MSSAPYGGSLHYVTSDYEPTKPQIYSSPLNHSTSAISPKVDNASTHHCPQHYVSTTNLSVNATLSRPEQQDPNQLNNYKSSLYYSSPYLSQVYDEDATTYRFLYQQQAPEHHSTVGSDSGIVIIQPGYQQATNDDNKGVERKLKDLVQKLENQLETDTLKLNNKLDTKLKSLENMIHQQTFVIREQDQVIENLKTKISKIETERDHFRDQLGAHEQRERNENPYFPGKQKDPLRGMTLIKT